MKYLTMVDVTISGTRAKEAVDVGKGFPSNNISRAADTRIPLLPADQAGTLQLKL